MSVVREVDSHDPLSLPDREHCQSAPRPCYERVKRVLDLCVAGTTLTALAPLLLLAAAAIKLSSPGPVLYRGMVIGRWGRPFTYYKLRTMVVDGDDAAHRDFIATYVTRGSPDDGPCKLVDDPRITPIGRILRRSSLDEVAQMINVIRGEMSIVGPRPPVPYEYGLYDDNHKQRLAVLPGITGLAQVRARSRASFEEMVAIDLEYIGHRSVRNDLAIMARTVWVVLSGRGAH